MRVSPRVIECERVGHGDALLIIITVFHLTSKLPVDSVGSTDTALDNSAVLILKMNYYAIKKLNTIIFCLQSLETKPTSKKLLVSSV